MWTQPQKWFHIVRIIDDGRTWAVHFQKRVCTKYNICHDLNCHLQQSKDDNWKRKLSPVDETIINGSKLVRSPKTDPGIKMERKKKAAGLLLQISTLRCGITLCKSGTAGRLEWLVCTSGRPGCLAATKGDPTHVSDPKTGSADNDQWLNDRRCQSERFTWELPIESLRSLSGKSAEPGRHNSTPQNTYTSTPELKWPGS